MKFLFVERLVVMEEEREIWKWVWLQTLLTSIRWRHQVYLFVLQDIRHQLKLSTNQIIIVVVIIFLLEEIYKMYLISLKKIIYIKFAVEVDKAEF